MNRLSLVPRTIGLLLIAILLSCGNHHSRNKSPFVSATQVRPTSYAGA